MSRIEWGNYTPQSPGDNDQAPPESRSDSPCIALVVEERTWLPPERTVVCREHTSCVTEWCGVVTVQV